MYRDALWISFATYETLKTRNFGTLLMTFSSWLSHFHTFHTIRAALKPRYFFLSKPASLATEREIRSHVCCSALMLFIFQKPVNTRCSLFEEPCSEKGHCGFFTMRLFQNLMVDFQYFWKHGARKSTNNRMLDELLSLGAGRRLFLKNIPYADSKVIELAEVRESCLWYSLIC